MSFNKKHLSSYPSSAGVYLMKNKHNQVLYVGKAKNLKNRIKQYFSYYHDERKTIAFLLPQIATIEIIVVPTEKEALLLENTLIKKHRPKYNILLKDDKTYVCIELSHHKWPLLRLTRLKKTTSKTKSMYFGPYTNAQEAKNMLEVIFQTFHLRQCSDYEFINRTRPCLLYDIKRCLGPCTNMCTKQQYAAAVQKAKEFLKGQNKTILKRLKKMMQKEADRLEYEKAQKFLQIIKQIEKATTQQHVHVFKKDSIDAIGTYQTGLATIIQILLIREGKLSGSQHFSFFETISSKEEVLQSFLMQHYKNTNILPKDILLPINLSNQTQLQDILNSSSIKHTRLSTPQKGHKKQLILLANRNAKSSYEQEKNQQSLYDKLLLELQETLQLTNFPKTIECVDMSNTATQDNVAAIVAFTNGKKDPSKTRYFTAKTQEKGDCPILKHVLTRHLKRQKEKGSFTDLILIDGGKAQLNATLKVFDELDIASIDALAITKEKARHDKGLTHERLYFPGKQKPIILDIKSPLLFFLQKIRDEAHRTAISFHRKRREKKIYKSILDDIEGIGPKKKKALLKYFKSIERIKHTDENELKKVKKLTQKDRKKIKKFFSLN